MPSIAKRRHLRKKYRKLLPKDKINANSITVFADKIEQVRKENYGPELTKTVDCFLDCHGS